MNELYEGLAEIFEIEAGEITPEFDLQSANWDSLAIVSTIALVDDCFNVMLKGSALRACNTVADIEKLIAAAKE